MISSRCQLAQFGGDRRAPAARFSSAYASAEQMVSLSDAYAENQYLVHGRPSRTSARLY
jgi:hypothetical protein